MVQRRRPRPSTRRRGLLAAAVLALGGALLGPQPAFADDPSVRPLCGGDDGCWPYFFQYVRLDKVVTGLGPRGAGDTLSFDGQISCIDWLEPDFFTVDVPKGASTGTTGVWVKQLDNASGWECTVSESDPRYGTSGLYAVAGPTTFAPATFRQPDWSVQTDEDHPMAVVVSTSAFQAATIGGTAWDDRDRDGVKDPGEPGLAGVRVQVDAHGDRAHPARSTATTTADGSYAVAGLAAGDYTVTFPRLPGRRPVGSAGDVRSIGVDPGAVRTGVDQGYARVGVKRPPRDR